jgi:hypothetical protein
MMKDIHQTYREEQRYARNSIIGIVTIVAVLLVMLVVQALMGKFFSALNWGIALSFTAFLIATAWFLSRFRLIVRLNEKNLKVEAGPFHLYKRKIKWKNVQEIELIHLPRFYQWLGWNVHFSAGNGWYSIGERSVARIVLKDGHVVFVGCREVDRWKELLREFDRTKDFVAVAG